MSLKLNKLIRPFLFVALFAVAIFPNFSAAQSSTGTLSGKISDSRGGVLQGAQISLNPGGATAVSDVLGEFRIPGVDPGNYTVTITYVGFKTYTKTMTLTAGQVTSLDAELAVESVDVEVEVV